MNHPHQDPIPEPSALEKVAGNPVGGVVLHVASAAAQALPGEYAALTPCIDMLSSLRDTVAGKLHAERLEKAIRELDAKLLQLGDKIKNLTEDQYHFTNEAVSHILGTIKKEKLALLQDAVVSAVSDPSAVDGYSEALARLIRDISTQEAVALTQLFEYEAIGLIDKQGAEIAADMYGALRGSDEARHIEGLITLGLLQSHAPTWDLTRYERTPLAAKCIALIRKP